MKRPVEYVTVDLADDSDERFERNCIAVWCIGVTLSPFIAIGFAFLLR